MCTNAIKHGALSVPEGRVIVGWDIRLDDQAHDFALTWQERDGPQTRQAESIGFGSKVLSQLMPAAIFGQSETEMAPGGLIWRLKGRLNAMSSTDAQGPELEGTLPAPV